MPCIFVIFKIYSSSSDCFTFSYTNKLCQGYVSLGQIYRNYTNHDERDITDHDPFIMYFNYDKATYPHVISVSVGEPT